MSNSWVAWYPGDYMRDTGHLSLVEDGAYRRLLDHYYATGRALPTGHDALCRICRAMTDEERAAVASVVGEFFERDGSVLRNNRADREILRRREVHEKLAEAGRRGGLNKPHKPGLKPGLKPPSSLAQASPQPQPQPHPEPDENILVAPDGAVSAADIYAAYPRKVGRPKALKAIERAMSKVGADELLTRTRAYAQSAKAIEPQFVPHPATWFNQERYADDPATWCPASTSGKRSETPKGRVFDLVDGGN